MVIALTQHYLKPSSSSSSSISSSPLTRERMSSKPGVRQQASKKTHAVADSNELDTPRPVMTPLASRGVSAKCLPRLSPESSGSGEGKRARRVVVMRRASEGSCSRSGVSTVVELPGINSRRHSVAGTISSTEESNLQVFVSPLRSTSSVVGGEAAVAHGHFASSSFRVKERPLLVRRSGPGTTPIPPSSPRARSHINGPAELNNNRSYVKSGCGSSRHFELTLQKIEETKPHHQDIVFPLRPRRKTVQRKNAVSSIDRQYLGGEDDQEFRSSVEGRRYANISEMPPEYAEELLSQQEEDICFPEETEDEHLRQKCLKWLETLPQK